MSLLVSDQPHKDMNPNQKNNPQFVNTRRVAKVLREWTLAKLSGTIYGYSHQCMIIILSLNTEHLKVKMGMQKIIFLKQTLQEEHLWEYKDIISL